MAGRRRPAQLECRTRGPDPTPAFGGPAELHKRLPGSRRDGVRAEEAPLTHSHTHTHSLTHTHTHTRSPPYPHSRAALRGRPIATLGRRGPAARPRKADALPDAQSSAGAGTPTRRQKSTKHLPLPRRKQATGPDRPLSDTPLPGPQGCAGGLGGGSREGLHAVTPRPRSPASVRKR